MIPGCEEFSGKCTSIQDIRFLGLGYNDTWYLSKLRPLIDQYKKEVDVVIMHGSRIRLVSSLEPLIILRGGYAIGTYFVHDIPSIFNNSGAYTLIEFQEKDIIGINQYHFIFGSEHTNRQTKSIPTLLDARAKKGTKRPPSDLIRFNRRRGSSSSSSRWSLPTQ